MSTASGLAPGRMDGPTERPGTPKGEQNRDVMGPPGERRPAKRSRDGCQSGLARVARRRPPQSPWVGGDWSEPHQRRQSPQIWRTDTRTGLGRPTPDSTTSAENRAEVINTAQASAKSQHERPKRPKLVETARTLDVRLLDNVARILPRLPQYKPKRTRLKFPPLVAGKRPSAMDLASLPPNI